MMKEVPDENTPLLKNSGGQGKPSNINDGNSSHSTSTPEKLKKILSNVTVEPILFFHSLAYAVDGIFYTNMIIDKTCRIQLNYSEEICDNLDSGNYGAQQDEVQRLTNKYQLYSSWIEYFPAIFIVILLGAWSDVRGRKLPILIPMIGSTFKAIGLFINAYFWSLKPYCIVLSYIPYGLGGGAMTIFMAAYALIGDTSSTRTRTMRLSFTGIMMYAASPIGHGLGTVLYKRGGYILVFGVEVAISFLSVAYGLLRLKDTSVGSKNDTERSQRGKKLTLNSLKASLKVVTKKREDHQRAHLIGHICCIWIYMISIEASSYTFLYTRKRFEWNYYNYTMWSIINAPASFFSSCLLLPLLSYHYQIEDTILGFAGAASHVFFGILVGTTPVSWVLYLAIVVSSPSSMVFSSSRGALSKIVTIDELGAVFSLIALGETIIPIIMNPVFNIIYNSTLDTYPGTIFLVDAAVGVIVCFIYAKILTSGKPMKAKMLPGP